MLVPLPLANVIPSLAIGLIAFASIEADGVLLAVAMGAAVVSLAISAATVWAMLGAAFWVWSKSAISALARPTTIAAVCGVGSSR